MMRLALAPALLLVTGCPNSGDDPTVEIVNPPGGTMVTTDSPIAFEVRVTNLKPGATDVYLDNTLIPEAQLIGSCPVNGGTGQIIWTMPSAANGPHQIRVSCIDDLVEYSGTVALVFARP
jgi:hypothetical protein